MIKKSVFEEELIAGMHHHLVKQAKQEEYDHLEKAADYLNSAAEIFEDMGMNKNADRVLMILAKIAQKHQHEKSDRHTKGLTPERMVNNLKQHGHPMNVADDHLADTEIEDTLEVSDGESELHDFEDERNDSFHSHAIGHQPHSVFPEEWDDSKKEKFVNQLKHELWINTDDYDWKNVNWRDLLSYVDLDKDIDENVNNIGMRGVVPRKHFKLKSHEKKERFNPDAPH